MDVHRAQNLPGSITHIVDRLVAVEDTVLCACPYTVVISTVNSRLSTDLAFRLARDPIEIPLGPKTHIRFWYASTV